MKVCRIEGFPDDKIECRKCPYAQHFSVPIVCRILHSIEKEKDGNKGYIDFECPSKGCRDDCPLIPCEGIKGDLEGFNDMVLYEGSIYKINDDSIKFIKACEDNQ